MAPSKMDTVINPDIKQQPNTSIIIDPQTVLATFLGHNIGDALGVPVEFVPREALKDAPIADMCSFGTHCMPAGVWSDDSSMTIALIDSLIQNRSFDFSDIMDRFVKWRFEGEYSAGGVCFDIGGTCSRALHNYINGARALDSGPRSEGSNGNGSLMRIAPVAFVAHQNQLSAQETYNLTAKVSQLTHGHVVSILGCYLYVWYLRYLLEGNSPQEAYQRLQTDTDLSMSPPRAKVHYNRVIYHNIASYSEELIESGGYVVDTLEASLWSLLNSTDYESAVLTAVNLGEDTDTTGAVTGAMAGLAYGLDDIPIDWLDQLERADYLKQLYLAFATALPSIEL